MKILWIIFKVKYMFFFFSSLFKKRKRKEKVYGDDITQRHIFRKIKINNLFGKEIKKLNTKPVIFLINLSISLPTNNQ